MKKEYYQPANNYERNFLMVKKFGGKLTVLLIPVLMFISILCSVYIKVSDEQSFELNILKVVTSKFNLDFDFGSFQTLGFVFNILIYAFFIYAFLYIFFTSRNSSFTSNPDLGFSLLHKFSVLELVASVFAFIGILVTTAVFIFGDMSRFESLGAMFNLSVTDLEAYKLTIVFLLIGVVIIAFLSIWYIQSQTDFLKSIRQSLAESVPKNKGAHTYGVFSMAIAIVFLSVAGFCTFMYYCYRDAFGGFGISLDETYVYISMVNSYVKGFIPFLVGVNAFSFSTMVDESNTIGTLYNNYTVIGEATDPNMVR